MVASLAGGIGGSVAGIPAGTAIGSVVPVMVLALVVQLEDLWVELVVGTAFDRYTDNWINWLR